MNHAFTIIPLTIEARGEIITNNLPEFRELVLEALGNINRDLKTDEEFGQAELDVKALKAAEDAVRAAAIQAFDEKLKELVAGLDATAEEIRAPRLELEKLISKRKDEVKTEIIEYHLEAFDIDPKDARKHYLEGLQNAIKGKRTVESMRTACRVYQTTQQAMIIKSRATVERFVGKFGADLVMDRRELELKNVETVEAELVRRIEAKKAAEELAKSQAEAAANAEAAKAKAALAEGNKPPAAPVNPLPSNVEQGPWKDSGDGGTVVATAPVATTVAVPATGPSAAEEWAEFKTAVIAAFGPIKAARAGLKHAGNAAKAQVFANAVGAAWKEVL